MTARARLMRLFAAFSHEATELKGATFLCVQFYPSRLVFDVTSSYVRSV